jgi:IS4 transposase
MNPQIQWETLPAGALRIGDLGYYNLKEFKKMDSDGVYWLSRVKSNCVVYRYDKRWDLPGLLRKCCKDRMDIQVLLGADERVPCRLLAVRVPDDVAKLRRCQLISEAKGKGKPVSDKALELASWIVLCCNIPHEMLNLDEAFVLMRTRWQIELIFKLWKSHGCIDEWRTESPWRILCEVYAKLIVMLIQHWVLLAGCWQYPNRSLSKAVKTIQKHAMNLACAFASGRAGRLYEALKTIQRCLSVGCRINKRRKNPSTYQLLLAFDDSS